MAGTTAIASLPRFVRGIVTPTFTPFDKQGRIDLDGFRSLVEWNKSRRIVSTVFARCGVGKMYVYTYDEVRAVIDVVTEAAAGEIGVMVGTGGEFSGKVEQRPDPKVYLRQTIELTQYAESKGVDAAVLPVPLALAGNGKPVAEVIFDFYKTVAGETKVPLFVYRMPGLPPEYEITPDLLARLLEIPNIIGMKFSSTDIPAFAALAEVAKRRPFGFICGAEHAYAPTLPLGITGVIGGGCNTHPEVIYGVQEAFVWGDEAGMAKAHQDVLRGLEVWKGKARTILAMQYLARKGVKVQPYQRAGLDPYKPQELEGEPYPDEVVDAAEKELDSIVGPYRERIQKGDGRVLVPGDVV